MSPRLGLFVSLFAALLSGPGLAQTQQGPISLTPPRPAPDTVTPQPAAPTPAPQATPEPAPAASAPVPPTTARRPWGPAATRASTAKAKSEATGPKGVQKPPPLPTTGLRQTSIGVPRTLNEALAATYANQPALQAERAKLRATDETVPAALA